jgi:glucose dehydrogenase
MKTTMRLVALALIVVALPAIAHGKPVTSEDLVKAQENTAEWLTYGRDYRNWRYSPLTEITPDNAAKLSPVWAMSTGGQFGGLESTPLFRDGVLYFSADYARVFAVDAKTGNIVWRYDPEYEDGLTAMLCCGPIHRGIALKDDMVLVARLDAKLVALNRTDGKVIWEAKIDEWKNGVTTNSAPLVVNDHVIIGVSGGEYGVRGYSPLMPRRVRTNGRFTVRPGEPGMTGPRTTPGRAAAADVATGSTMPRPTRSIGVSAIRRHGPPRHMPATIFGPSPCSPLTPTPAR